MESLNATQLNLGETATIEAVLANENQERLYELGFIEGVSITKAHCSFDGFNICFAINNTMFALRQKDAQFIKVSRK